MTDSDGEKIIEEEMQGISKVSKFRRFGFLLVILVVGMILGVIGTALAYRQTWNQLMDML